MTHSHAELIRRIQEGRDGEAFTILYSAHFRDVIRLMMSGQCEATEAEDAAQYAFICLWTRKGGTIAGNSVLPLLFTYARNYRVNLLRERARHPMIAIESPTKDKDDKKRFIDLPYIVRTAEPDMPEDILAALPSALSTLDERTQKIIRMRFGEDVTLEVIARDIGLTQSTISRELRDGLRKLRKILRVPEPKETNYLIHKRPNRRERAYASCASVDRTLGEISDALKKPIASVRQTGCKKAEIK